MIFLRTFISAPSKFSKLEYSIIKKEFNVQNIMNSFHFQAFLRKTLRTHLTKGVTNNFLSFLCVLFPRKWRFTSSLSVILLLDNRGQRWAPFLLCSHRIFALMIDYLQISFTSFFHVSNINFYVLSHILAFSSCADTHCISSLFILSKSVFICLSVCLSVYLAVYLSIHPSIYTRARARTKDVSKSIRTDRLERELQMVQLSAIKCSCMLFCESI
jgi:hypothetical protein